MKRRWKVSSFCICSHPLSIAKRFYWEHVSIRMNRLHKKSNQIPRNASLRRNLKNKLFLVFLSSLNSTHDLELIKERFFVLASGYVARINQKRYLHYSSTTLGILFLTFCSSHKHFAHYCNYIRLDTNRIMWLLK